MYIKSRFLNIHFFAIILLIGASVPFTSCNVSKKYQEVPDVHPRQAEAIEKLNKMLLDESGRSIDERQKELDDIKSWNLIDGESADLIYRVQRKLTDEFNAQKEKEKALLAAENKEKSNAMKMDNRKIVERSLLENYFREIQVAPNPERCDKLIADALKRFSSDDVPVLILLSEDGGVKDYDQPTTITNYLHYLKDNRIIISESVENVTYQDFLNRRKINNAVTNIEFDENFKIKELELIKK